MGSMHAHGTIRKLQRENECEWRVTGRGLLWMCGSGTHCVALLTTCMDVKVKAWNTKLNYVILHHTHTHSGVWNVPFISSAILFSGTWLRAHRYDLPTFTSEQWEPDMAFAAWMREKVPCYVCVCVCVGGKGNTFHCQLCKWLIKTSFKFWEGQEISSSKQVLVYHFQYPCSILKVTHARTGLDLGQKLWETTWELDDVIVLTLCCLHDHLIQLPLQLLIHLQLLPLVRKTGLQFSNTKITLTLHRPQFLGQHLNLSMGGDKMGRI